MINTSNFLFGTLFDSITTPPELISKDLNHSSNESEGIAVSPSDSFLVLIAHVFSEAIINSDVMDDATKDSIPSDSIDQSELSKSAELYDDQLSGAVPANLIALNDNIALNWINSESYQPPALESVPNNQANKQMISRADEYNLSLLDAENTLRPITKSSAPIYNATTIELGQNNTQQDETVNPLLSNKITDFLDKGVSDKQSENEVAGDIANNGLQTKESTNDNVLIDCARTGTNTFSHQVTQSAIGAANKSSLPLFDIPQSINSKQWADTFSERIVWFSQNEIKSALIKITPEDLGPLEINIKIVKEMASVDIVSHSMQAKEVIEQALPRLRDMMFAQGLELFEVSVEAETSSHHFSKNHQPSELVVAESTHENAPEALTPLTRPKLKGLVDYFA